MKELEQFLLNRAMEHDSPTLLFNLAAEYLISAKVIRPGVVTLMEMVGAARAGAGELTFEQVRSRCPACGPWASGTAVAAVSVTKERERAGPGGGPPWCLSR